MNIGITLMLSDQTITVTEAAPAVEERGFESFWVGEHTHCPVGTVHSYTQGRYGTGTVTKDGYLPDFYKRFPDPYITLTAAALCTSTVRIGTCIALPAEHRPLILAKVIATLDVLSGVASSSASATAGTRSRCKMPGSRRASDARCSGRRSPP